MAVGTDYGALRRKRKNAEFGLCPTFLVRNIDFRQATLTEATESLTYQPASPERAGRRDADSEWRNRTVSRNSNSRHRILFS